MKITVGQLRKIISEEVAVAAASDQRDFLIFTAGQSGAGEGRPVGIMTASSEASAIKLARASRRIMSMADGEVIYAVEIPFGESDAVTGLISRLESLRDEVDEIESELLAYRYKTRSK